MRAATFAIFVLLCGVGGGAHADAPGPVPPIDCAAPKIIKPHRKPVRRGVVPRIPYVSLLCPAPLPPRLVIVVPPSEQDYDRPAFLTPGHSWPGRPSYEQQWEADERLGRHPRPVVVHSVPEPSTLWLALGALGWAVRKRQAA